MQDRERKLPVPTGFSTVFHRDRLWDLTECLCLTISSVQYKIIRELAEKEPCVIVGRCGDYVLEDRDDCLHVFVHAPLEFKKERILRLYGERKERPEKRLERKR